MWHRNKCYRIYIGNPMSYVFIRWPIIGLPPTDSKTPADIDPVFACWISNLHYLADIVLESSCFLRYKFLHPLCSRGILAASYFYSNWYNLNYNFYRLRHPLISWRLHLRRRQICNKIIANSKVCMIYRPLWVRALWQAINWILSNSELYIHFTQNNQEVYNRCI